jgi:hypothetical protein
VIAISVDLGRLKGGLAVQLKIIFKNPLDQPHQCGYIRSISLIENDFHFQLNWRELGKMLENPEFNRLILKSLVLVGTSGFFGCSGTSEDVAHLETNTGTPVELPDSYQFTNGAGESTVSYSGQTARHALIEELDVWIGDITAKIDDGSYQPGKVDAVTGDLGFYFDCAADLCANMGVGDPTTLQQTLADISIGKNLVAKLAGKDALTDHQDWTGGSFVGWKGAGSPESLVREWFAQIGDQAVGRVNGEVLLGPAGEPIPTVYLTPQGQDLRQLTEKFLLGGVAFSQGTDDYLDDDVDGKGLLASHATFSDASPYTDLEHAWDEGFGYFGAARNYLAYTDVQLAAGELLDIEGDGLVDLTAEKNWGHSVNAAKRDAGANPSAPTDFTEAAWAGFAGGRQLLSTTAGSELSDTDFQALLGFRDQATLAWENAIAATVVHYINDVLQDMGEFGSQEYSFSAHAKHWSELKGFALGLQFNPASPMSAADFESFHALVGDAPVLGSASAVEIAAYQEALVEARDLLGNAYGYDSANLGDSGGEGGW